MSFSLLTHDAAEGHDGADDGEEDEEDGSDALHRQRVRNVTQVVRVTVLYVVHESTEYPDTTTAQNDRTYGKTTSSSLAQGSVLSAGSRGIMHTEAVHQKHVINRMTLKFNGVPEVIEVCVCV